MKYDVLNEYREYLYARAGGGGLRPQTVHKYFYKMDSLLEGQNPLTDNFDMSKVLENLGNIKYKNYFAQAKGALLHFCKFQAITLDDNQLRQIEEMQENTTKKYRSLDKLTANFVEKTKKKVEGIKNPKLRLSYETAMATGLRVSEIAQLTPGNAVISDEAIIFTITRKGGEEKEVAIVKSEHKKLYEKVRKMTESLKPNDRVFYSVATLQKEAKKVRVQMPRPKTDMC